MSPGHWLSIRSRLLFHSSATLSHTSSLVRNCSVSPFESAGHLYQFDCSGYSTVEIVQHPFVPRGAAGMRMGDFAELLGRAPPASLRGLFERTKCASSAAAGGTLPSGSGALSTSAATPPLGGLRAPTRSSRAASAQSCSKIYHMIVIIQSYECYFIHAIAVLQSIARFS